MAASGAGESMGRGRVGSSGKAQRRPEQNNRFVREGEYWTVEFEGAVVRLRDSKGMRHLAWLLSRPGEAFRASSLARAAQMNSMPEVRVTDDGSAAGNARADENSRVAVTRVIHASVRRVAASHPALGDHLRTTIRTGRLCRYTPDAGECLVWEVQPAGDAWGTPGIGASHSISAAHD